MKCVSAAALAFEFMRLANEFTAGRRPGFGATLSESRCHDELRSFAILSKVSDRTKLRRTLVDVSMPREVEIKLKVTDARTLLRVLKKLGAQLDGNGSGRVHEMNVIFDTPQGGLAKHGQLLRIRTETPESAPKKANGRHPSLKLRQRSVLTFKKPLADSPDEPAKRGSARHKVREELEVEVTDPGKLTQIFEGLGMKGWFRYEKYRTTYRLPRVAWAKGLLIELDETPIGIFVELEGPPQAIDRAARALGYTSRDYILKNYLVLNVEACRQAGREPSDMFFDPAK